MKRAAVLVLLVVQATFAEGNTVQPSFAEEALVPSTQENDTVENLDRCFAATKTANAICESSTAESAPRVECLKKVLLAQQDCLDHVRIGGRLPPPTRPAEQAQERLRGRTEAARETDNNSLSPPSQLAAPSPSPPGQVTGWTVSETTSPIDYSPVVRAAIASLASSGAMPPSELVIGCRGTRIEIALHARQRWVPARGGTVEVVIAPEGGATRRERWILSPSGGMAMPDGDASEILQQLLPARTVVSVADGGGHAAGVFDLTSLDPVRDRLWQTCRDRAAVMGAASTPAPTVRTGRTKEKRRIRTGEQ